MNKKNNKIQKIQLEEEKEEEESLMRKKGGARERWERHEEVYRQVLSYLCLVNLSF